MAHDKRVIDLRTRLVHAAELEKEGHYNYTTRTACGFSTSYKPMEFWDRPKDEPVSCMACIAEMIDATD